MLRISLLACLDENNFVMHPKHHNQEPVQHIVIFSIRSDQGTDFGHISVTEFLHGMFGLLFVSLHTPKWTRMWCCRLSASWLTQQSGGSWWWYRVKPHSPNGTPQRVSELPNESDVQIFFLWLCVAVSTVILALKTLLWLRPWLWER